jgi:hypothetical protein
VTDAERIAVLERRVAALEQIWDAWLNLQQAKQRARDRANGEHLRLVPDRH